MLNSNFVILAGIINLIGNLSYIIEIFKGKAKPNKVTWLLWGIAPLIAFFAQISQGVGISSFLTLTFGIGPLFVFLISFLNKKSYWQISKFDIFCGSVSLLALAIWAITKDSNIALLVSIIADIFASTPTIIKTWNNPETEDYKAYLATIISIIVTLFTIKVWNFASIAFPIYLLIFCTYYALAIIFPKLRLFSRFKSR